MHNVIMCLKINDLIIPVLYSVSSEIQHHVVCTSPSYRLTFQCLPLPPCDEVAFLQDLEQSLAGLGIAYEISDLC